MAKTKTSDKGESKTSSTDHTRRGKRKSEKSDGMMIIMPFGEHEDLIVPFLLEFMDVPTLVSLGSTNKKNQVHLPEQVVARRKFRFQAIKNESSNKLLSDDNLMPFRKNMYQALRFRLEACILIGSGLRRENHELVMDDYDFTTRSACTSVCSRGRLFADKRKLLNAHLSTALL